MSLTSVVAFIATARADVARDFYQQVLGLTLVEDSPFALVFTSGGTTLRVQKVPQVAVAPYTALGWSVADIRATARELAAKGVTFQRYDGLAQDADGIWEAPGGALVAWFRDPNGNTLSITQGGTP